MRRRSSAGVFAAIVALVGSVLLAAPAEASTNLGTFTYDCNTQTTLTIVGAPGDTATVDSVNCPLIPIGVRGYSAPLVNADFTVTGGLLYLNPTTITLPSSFADLFLVYWQYGGGFGPSYGIKLTITSGGGGSGGSGGAAASDSGPVQVRQGLPLPQSGLCEDVKDADFAWNTGLSGGWQRGWEPWPNEGRGGWACIRVMENADGVWRFADRKHY